MQGDWTPWYDPIHDHILILSTTFLNSNFAAYLEFILKTLVSFSESENPQNMYIWC